jgi:uncharacterized protein YbbK (DUF523 family)
MSIDRKIIVSACLSGEICRYDGLSAENKAIKELVMKGKAIPVCPEVLGGLPVPRVPAEIEAGDGQAVLEGRSRVRNEKGEDVTREYLAGAYKVLEIAQEANAAQAILKSKSPSCGVTRIKRGEKSIRGMGVAAALLQLNGVSLEEVE